MQESIAVPHNYHPVHLPEGHDFGTAHINGRKVKVDDDYLNSLEARNLLEALRQKVHRRNMAFLEIADHLDVIEESKVYLCIADESGAPVFHKWDDFLQSFVGLGRSAISRMRSARKGYRWIEKTYGESADTLLGRLPTNMNFFYILDQIPEQQREAAIKAVLKDGVPTAKALGQWRKNGKALAALKASIAIEEHEQSVHEDEEQNDDDAPSSPESPASDPKPVSSPEPSSCMTPPARESELVHDVQAVAIPVDEALSYQTNDVEQAVDVLKRMRTTDEDYSFEDFTLVICGILQSVEYQKLVAEEAVEHSDRGDLKPGKKTVRNRINDAISAFSQGVNQAQLEIMSNKSKT